MPFSYWKFFVGLDKKKKSLCIAIFTVKGPSIPFVKKEMLLFLHSVWNLNKPFSFLGQIIHKMSLLSPRLKQSYLNISRMPQNEILSKSKMFRFQTLYLEMYTLSSSTM